MLTPWSWSFRGDQTAVPTKDFSRVSDIGTEVHRKKRYSTELLIVAQTALLTVVGIYITLNIAFTNKHIVG